MNPFFTMNPELLIKCISNAKKSLLLLTPGITEEVAKKLIETFRQGIIVTIVTKIKEGCFRQGYGEFEAVKMLLDQELVVIDSDQIDIGFLIVDGTFAYIYSPIPQAIVDIPAEKSSQNAVMMRGNWVQDFYDHIITRVKALIHNEPPLAEDSTLTVIGEKDSDDFRFIPRVASMEIKKPDESVLKVIEDNIQLNPIQSFDLSKKLTVYKNFFQYIDIKFVNSKIERQTIKLKGLFSVPKDFPRDLVSRFETIFKVFTPEDFGYGLIGLKELEIEFSKIKKKYLRHIAKRGNVFLINEKNNLKEDIEGIREKIEQEKAGIKMQLIQRGRTSIDAICMSLTPDLISEYRDRLLYKMALTDDEVVEEIRSMLRKNISKKINSVTIKIDIEYSFKDITYEDIKDPEFVENLMTEFSELNWHEIEPYDEYSTVSPLTKGKNND